MKPINLVRVISELPVGGVENRLLEILPGLRSQYNVRLCCIRVKGELAPEFEKAGIPVDLCYFRGRLHPVSLFQMASYLKKVKAQIVHTHMYRPNISAVAAARLAGVPVIISNIHNIDHWDNRRQVKQDARFAPLRDKVIAVSQAVRQDYLARTDTAPDKCVVIYNGINLERFHPREKDPELINELGLQNKKVVGIFARIVPQKDHESFLKSAALIKKEVVAVRFLIVGEEEGGLLKKLQAQVKEMGLEKEVVMTGKRRDIPSLLALCDVTVLSSLKEGFSNAVVESMAMGVPMVASDVGGNAEAIVDGETGFIVPPRKPELLAQRVIKILSDNELAEKMGFRAKDRAKLFSLETMRDNTDKLYRSLLELKRK